ncbi:HNH endonuclease signature motif containing protein [Agromyces flavus]|uniref:HNH endonuclease signature motif containing protein n=1 Tax=Agromyces flavus TaxID=589382 RepID=UPI002F913DFA
MRIRDGGCRFPGCARRATTTDLDHTTAWAHGGRTDADNLAHLCRSHHRLKHHTGWRMHHRPDGTIHWTSPAGHHLTTHPEHPFTPVGAPPEHQPHPPAPQPLEPPSHDSTADIGERDDPPWAARAA